VNDLKHGHFKVTSSTKESTKVNYKYFQKDLPVKSITEEEYKKTLESKLSNF